MSWSWESRLPGERTTGICGNITIRTKTRDSIVYKSVGFEDSKAKQSDMREPLDKMGREET
jgi:hypothetical protein